jgi:hypothetical protein
MLLHGQVLDEATAHRVITFDVPTDEVSEFHDLVSPSRHTTTSSSEMVRDHIRLVAQEIRYESLKS